MTADPEVIFAFVIILVMMVLAFKGGRNNPVTTGKLQQDLHTTKNKMMVIAQELAGAATKEDLENLRREISGSATSDEVAELSDKVTAVCTKVEGIEKMTDRTHDGVKRIEKMFLQKGINGQ